VGRRRSSLRNETNSEIGPTMNLVSTGALKTILLLSAAKTARWSDMLLRGIWMDRTFQNRNSHRPLKSAEYILQ